MSTEAIYVVTGRAIFHPSQHFTGRLLRAVEGYPSCALDTIAKATVFALDYMGNTLDVSSLTRELGRAPMLADMPARTFCYFLISGGMDWCGPLVRFDRTSKVYDKADEISDASSDGQYVQPVAPEMFSSANASWAYLVDVSRRSIHVFKTLGRSASVYLREGPVDPMSYLNDLPADQTMNQAAYAIRLACDRLVMTGWTINQLTLPPRLTDLKPFWG